MSYKVDRALGYQPWGVTNPWVFADLSQPQRQRGNVSPMVFQTAGPYLRSAHLGADEAMPASPEQQAEVEKLRQAVEEEERATRRDKIMVASFVVSAGALALSWASYREFRKSRLNTNKRRRRRRKRR